MRHKFLMGLVLLLIVFMSGMPCLADTMHQESFVDSTMRLHATEMKTSLPQQATTLVVAASDSSERAKAQADYVCDGVDDQVEIQAAIDALPPNGGKVVLLEGTYIKGNTDGISIASNTEIELIGATIKFKDNINADAQIFVNSDPTKGNSNIRIIGGTLDGNKVNQTAGTQSAIKFTKVSNSVVDCEIKNMRSHNILMSGDKSETGNVFTNRCYPLLKEVTYSVEGLINNHSLLELVDDFESGWSAGTHVTDVKYSGEKSLKLVTPTNRERNILPDMLTQRFLTFCRRVDGAVASYYSEKNILLDMLRQRFLTFCCRVDDAAGFYYYSEKNISLDMSRQRFLTFYFKVDDAAAFYRGSVYLACPDWTNYARMSFDVSESNKWVRVTLDFIEPVEAGRPDYSNVTAIKVRVGATAGQVATCWFDNLHLAKGHEGFVSITFDNSKREIYDDFFPVMQKYGFRGVNFDREAAGMSFMSLDQLKELQDMGWDISPHTLIDKTTESEVEDIIGNKNNWFISHGFEKGARFFAYGGGGTAGKALWGAKKYYYLSRGIGKDCSPFPVFDPLHLVAYDVEYGTPYGTPTLLKAKIDEARKYGGWLILLYHVVNPATVLPEFKEVMEYIDSVGIRVVTFSDMLDKYLPAVYEEVPCQDMFIGCRAESTNHVVIAEGVTQATPIACTIAARPALPRNVTITITDADSSITAFQITVAGVDAKGNSVSEVFTEAGGLTQTGNVAFATISSVTVDSITGISVGDVLDVGIGSKLGLSKVIYTASNVVKVKRNNADWPSANYTVDTIYGTVDVSTGGAIIAGDDFTIWYTSNQLVIRT